MAYEFEIAIFVTILVLIVVVALVLSAVRIINPWEQGLEIRLGSFMGKLNPGLRFVAPLVTTVVKIDLRTQVFDVPRQEVITKDNSPTNVDAIIYIKVIDPQKAFLQINNYRVATIALAHTTLRSTIGDMELDEILYNRHTLTMLFATPKGATQVVAAGITRMGQEENPAVSAAGQASAKAGLGPQYGPEDEIVLQHKSADPRLAVPARPKLKMLLDFYVKNPASHL